MIDKELIEKCLLTGGEMAKEKGFDNAIEWYLACLNAEINILLNPELRTKDRLDNLAIKAKSYIEKITKAIPIIRQAVAEERDKEEYDFLDKILHMPFFEFCLLIKERKQSLGKPSGKRG